jgi:two-component system, chemotaxis family, chemotaxis protein CheY
MKSSSPARVALLIDDEAYFRKFVGQVLRKTFVTQVIEARDGREGVKAFGENKPELVLLDINMPHMDGLKTLTELRKISAHVPIIMLTSLSEEKIVEQCVQAGATFFIRKDVPAAQLSAALHQALDEFVFEQKPPSA